MDEKRGGYRSLFWPIVLIGIGVVALLANAGALSRENISVLFRLWPVLLILIGIDIMFGRRSPAIGALIGIGAVAAVIGMMLVGPSLGWDQDWEVKTDRFSAPIGQATSARVELDLGSSPTELTALSDSDDLIDAELTYLGEIKFEVSGDQEKSVKLSESDGGRWFWFDWFNDDEELRWDVGLSKDLPLELNADGGSGSMTLDLAALQLTRLSLDVGSGSADLDLSTGSYPAQVDGGSGSTRLRVPAGAAVDLEIDVGSGSVTVGIADRATVELRIDGGSGSLTVDVPDDAAVRVDVRDSGSGSVRVPSRYERTRSGDRDEGTWETPGYGSADYQIEIQIESVGSGSLEVR